MNNEGGSKTIEIIDSGRDGEQFDENGVEVVVEVEVLFLKFQALYMCCDVSKKRYTKETR